jgi:hypothetical protein
MTAQELVLRLGGAAVANMAVTRKQFPSPTVERKKRPVADPAPERVGQPLCGCPVRPLNYRNGSRAADQVGGKESFERHRWTCNAERPLTKAQRAYSELAIECQVTIPADFQAAAANDRAQS